MDRLGEILDMLAADPKDVFLRYAECLERVKLGQHEVAAEKMEALIRDNPDYLAAYYQLGKAYEALQHWRQAFEAYKRGMVVAQKAGNSKTLAELALAAEIVEDDFL